MHNTISKKTSTHEGFTLVEIIVVLVILGIIASIGGTLLLRSLPNMRANSAIRDVYSTLMRAKTEAIRRGESVTVLFDTANNSYTLFLDRRPSPAFPADPVNDDDGQVDPNETILATATTFPLRVNYDPDPVFAGADGVADGVSFAGNTCVFTMRGMPAGPGSVGLLATDSAGNIARKRSVAVSLAGRINIQ